MASNPTFSGAVGPNAPAVFDTATAVAPAPHAPPSPPAPEWFARGGPSQTGATSTGIGITDQVLLSGATYIGGTPQALNVQNTQTPPPTATTLPVIP